MKQGFSEKIYYLARQIPVGKVTTYGQIATKLGNPKAARAVGNALHVHSYNDLPCHRVVNRKGRLATNFGSGGWQGQKKRLLNEKVSFRDSKHVDLKKHLWQKFT